MSCMCVRRLSGYIEVQKNNWHYIFQEAEIPGAPLLLFHPGGPGGSSVSMIFGFGQLQFSENSTTSETFDQTGVPQLQLNPFRWTKFFNLLAFDAPPPVGFGFCPEPADSIWDDERVTVESADFLEGFVKRHPQFRGRELYVFGGSYGGILAPMLAAEALQRTDDAEREEEPFPLNVVAVGAGNGAVGHFSGWVSHIADLFRPSSVLLIWSLVRLITRCSGCTESPGGRLG